MEKTTMMRRVVVPALTATAIAGAAAAPAGAMTKGLEDDAMVLSDDPALRQAFWTAAKEAKVKVVRVVPKWDTKATTIEPIQLLRVRRAIDEGRAVGAKLLVGIYQGAYRGKSRTARVSSSFQTNYIRYFQSLAQGIADKPVYGYLSWNEPNYGTTWPQARAKDWVKLSNRTYSAIKRVDKGAKVFVGETAPNVRNTGGKSTDPGKFFRTALGLNSKFKRSSKATKLKGDGFTLHTYDFVNAPNKAPKNKDAWVHGNLKDVVSQIKKLAKSGRLDSKAAKNIHITEFAYRSEPPNNKFSESKVSTYTRSAWNSAKKLKIKSFTWYMLRNPVSERDNFRSGLQDSTGKPFKVWSTFKKLK